jgi:ParB-like chromosome segregation protein Spo0J
MAARKIKGNVPLTEIHFDEELYPRSTYNWQTSYDYAESMKVGAKFPPIILALYKNKKYLVDGKHRYEAFKLIKKKTIPAIVYTGWNNKKIFEEAVKHNIQHGRVLSPYEKRNIALKLKQWKYPAAKISDLIQVPMDKLERFIGVRLVNTLTGDLEFECVVKSGIKHLAGGTLSEEEFHNVQIEQKKLYIHDQIDLLNQLISLLQKGLIDRKNKKILVLLKQIKKLV